ncbi:MAG: hemolysin family protein [Proteobacteria bacterium]|nr:HlyC/CorC family transporter [Desulfobacterales bacterium]MBL6967255.1 HlyC/CorC family transporter [Desulfobacteraceae bacterium]MBU0733361.1 hemolysin family protein [Pseudomonadota bacterium]MBL7101359.1 HlyC/CorC family transporter [Desulfobacteraceae bacterium]MBL7171585.1 HlyC/CorC family transporter [Desulfobacteraceae bacterium]
MQDDPEQGFFGLIKSLIKKKARLDDSNDLAEGIHDLMDEGQAKGLITNEESHMVYGVLDLKETEVHSIMIPRIDISSASVDSTIGEIIDLVTNCGHTRIPIHKDDIDRIVGILHSKDLLKLLGEEPSSRIPLDILRKAFFVPESRRVSDLLKDLQEKRTHLAIVTDEYGGTAGIITVEDILEEIVGEIMDEHDHEESLLTVLDDGSLLVDARLEVEKLGEALQMDLPKGEFESVGGFIIHLLGRIPEINEKVTFQDIEMTIQKANHRKIETVLISRTEQPWSATGKIAPPSGSL